jgi:hypothetical protein
LEELILQKLSSQHAKSLKIVIVLPLLLGVFAACSKGFKASGNRPTAQAGTGKANETNTNDPQTSIKPAGTSDQKGAEKGTGGVGDVVAASRVAKELCALTNKKRSILVVDLKSGWFAGDGGSLYKTLLDTKCASVVEFTYFHITEKLVEGNISENSMHISVLPCLSQSSTSTKLVKSSNSILGGSCQFESLNAFDQVWLLSGSELDADDVRLNSPLFVSLISQSKKFVAEKPQSGFFLGTGLGNTQHVSAFSKELFASEFVVPGAHGEIGVLPNPELFPTLTSLTHITASGGVGKILGEHPLFVNLPKGLPDTGVVPSWKVGNSSPVINRCISDSLSPDFTGGIVAWDNCGTPMIGFRKIDKSLILIDTNMPRFYLSNLTESISPEEYLHRIANYLSQDSL